MIWAVTQGIILKLTLFLTKFVSLCGVEKDRCEEHMETGKAVKYNKEDCGLKYPLYLFAQLASTMKTFPFVFVFFFFPSSTAEKLQEKYVEAQSRRIDRQYDRKQHISI